MKNHYAPRKKATLLIGVVAASAAISFWRQGTEPGLAAERLADDEIVDVLPRDQIPAVFAPQFVPADRAMIAASASVIGYAHGGAAHAYALNRLNGHEIVNDVVGKRKIAATW